MAVYHRTQRLQIYGEKPEVTKLFGDRYRMVVRCKAARDTEAWYNANKDQIFASFGTLYSAQMSVEGIDPRVGEAYPDMCLVSNSASYTQTGEYIISFVYETLTATWTKEQDDEITSTDNGLRVLQRSEVAAIDTAAPYDEDDVGVATITDADKTLYLASFQDQTGAESNAQVGRVVTRWAEAGILSVQQEFNNGLKRVSVQAFNLDSAAVSAALSEVTVDHKLIATNESDYEGIKTTTFQYQIDESFTEDYELNGLKRISLIELSATNFTAQDVGSVSTTAPTTGLYLATQDIDNGGAIKVRESTWIEAGTLNVQRRSESEGVYRVTTTFLGTYDADGVVGPIVAKSEDNYDGLKTITVVHMQKADGTSLIDDTNAIVTHNSLSEFSYPGIVTISNELLDSTVGTYKFQAKDFKLEPPSVTLIPSVTKVFFRTTNSISYSPEHSLWSPKTWAQGESRGIAWNYLPFSNTQAFRGYRIDASEGVTNSYFFTGALGGGETAWDMISGRRIYAGTKYRITVSGGPPNPVGNNYTLSYNIAHAFSDIDGTPYYKHTEVIATIPAKA